MSYTNRRAGVGVVVVLLAGSLIGGKAELAIMWPRLAFTAGCALAVILWVRPSAESDMIRKAEITGYLDGMRGRAQVIQLDERRRSSDRSGLHAVPDTGLAQSRGLHRAPR